MLHGITLDGFRSFAETTWIDLKPFTVLAGANNTGKSSVLGMLAALVQSEEQATGPALLLHGDWVALGRFNEAVNYRRTGGDRSFVVGLVGDVHASDVLWHFDAAEGEHQDLARCVMVEFLRAGNEYPQRVVLSGEKGSWEWRFPNGNWDRMGGAEMRSPASVHLTTTGGIEGKEQVISSEVERLLPVTPSTFRYIGPYRADPRDLYGGRSQPKGPPLGRDGAFTAEFLYRNRHRSVDLLPEPGAPLLLGEALNAWWSYVFDLRLTARVNELERIGYTLKVDTPSAESLGLGMVGLGLSQALPIIALVLGSKPGDVIAVETPEAHLHPGAQHRLARLLVAAAMAGRQVVVETHSEHVVNAVRLAVKARDLTSEQVALHFFEMDEDGSTVDTRIALDDSGRADRWPVGFFDQAARELADLL